MCGLNGLFAYSDQAAQPHESELLITRDYMTHRGPDGAGLWWSEGRRCALGHRRLSILDLSDRAAQPMAEADGRSVITFNGEIYNAPQLRAALEAEGVSFRTTSDTEVVLQLYRTHGPQMVSRLRGMFAFAIWDEHRQGLFLARDPYGIKPLYISDDGATFRFASQVKAMMAGGAVSGEPEPAGVVGFHVWGSVPEPFTLYRAVRSLPAGHTQWVDRLGARAPSRFADFPAVLAAGAEARCAPAEVAERVRSSVLDSVRAHLLADVEVGLFLSGGVDSGALLGLMRDAGQSRIRAITVRFGQIAGGPEDESLAAARIAALYGAEHIVRDVSAAEVEEDLPALLHHMDQPTIDGLNTWFASKAAREAGLKVALSGCGGDELFGGYPSFRDVPRWVDWLTLPSHVPGLGKAIRLGGRALGLASRSPKALGMVEYGGSYASAYLLRRALFLPFELETQLDPDLLHEGLEKLNLLGRLQASLTPDPGSRVGRVSALESEHYLRNQLLRDSDWSGMAHSLEIRTPLADFQLMNDVAAAVPHFTGWVGKRALGGSPALPLPTEVVERPKLGFWAPPPSGYRAGAHGLASRGWAKEVLRRQGLEAAGDVAAAASVG